MPLRFLLRYFANNEQLIEKLAESRFMRRLAQITAYSLNRAQAMGHEAIDKASDSEILKKMAEGSHHDKTKQSFSQNFARELREGMKGIEGEIKKKQLKD